MIGEACERYARAPAGKRELANDVGTPLPSNQGQARMKIVCDSCSAKYSIADEKVAGRVFKIRCKKCGAAIVVRGDQLDAGGHDEAAGGAVDYGGDAVWHIVIEGDQQGPFSPAQIGEMLSVGTIGWDAFVWREGFDDWKAAQDVEELVSAVMGGGDGGQSASDEGAAIGSAEMGADPFGAPAAEPPGGDLFGGRDDGADLFGGGHDASPFGGEDDDDVVASAPAAASPRVSADQALTGARNENSVLFSLSNLQALATGSGDAPSTSSAAAAPSAGPRPGMAAGEGSGLIDIRALAAATGVTGDGGPITSASNDKVDDLLSIGGGGAVGIGSSLGAPVLIPEKREERSNTGLIVGIAVAGISVVAAAAVVAVVLLTRDDTPTAAAASGALGPVQSGVTTAPETTTAAAPAPSAEPSPA
ncbi:MAG: zinc-ribbon domain-containing protein, partial [Sandaracinaceae bacterium]|nr:zinc-ribbon domain-containing protein [Sandaracinaceae bacterium]